MTPLSQLLLSKLACPGCKKKLEYEENNNRLLCRDCSLSYPVKDEIPVLLASAAVKMKQGLK